MGFWNKLLSLDLASYCFDFCLLTYVVTIAAVAMGKGDFCCAPVRIKRPELQSYWIPKELARSKIGLKRIRREAFTATANTHLCSDAAFVPTILENSHRNSNTTRSTRTVQRRERKLASVSFGGKKKKYISNYIYSMAYKKRKRFGASANWCEQQQCVSVSTYIRVQLNSSVVHALRFPIIPSFSQIICSRVNNVKVTWCELRRFGKHGGCFSRLLVFVQKLTWKDRETRNK